MYEVRGGEDLARLSRNLKEAGRKDLQRELTKAINDAVKPLKQKLPASALATLPRRGGLAQRVADSRLRLVRRDNRRGAGVQLQMIGKDSLRRINNGVIRHPVYARGDQDRSEWTWVTQRIRPKFADKPWDEEQDDIRRQVEAAMKTVARKIGQGV